MKGRKSPDTYLHIASYTAFVLQVYFHNLEIPKFLFISNYFASESRRAPWLWSGVYVKWKQCVIKGLPDHLARGGVIKPEFRE